MEGKKCTKDNYSECDLNELYAKNFKGGEYREQFYKLCDIEFRFWMTNIYGYFSKDHSDQLSRTLKISQLTAQQGHSDVNTSFPSSDVNTSFPKWITTATSTASDNASVCFSSIIDNLQQELPQKESCYQLLDFACGPVPIYAATTVAASFPAAISFADIVEDNRNEIDNWMKGDKEKCLSWEPQFKYMEKLSGRRLPDIESDLRASFKETLYANVHDELPIPGKKNYYDIIMTNLSLEYACVDMEKYKIATKNLGNMIKPGGYLMQGGALNVSHYEIDGKGFPACSLTFDKIEEVFEDPETDMQLLFYNTCKVAERAGVDGMEGIFYIVAQKMGKHVQKKELVKQVLKEDE